MRMPYVMSWSARIPVRVPRNWLLETQYQGQSGVGLINTLGHKPHSAERLDRPQRCWTRFSRRPRTTSRTRSSGPST